MPIVIREIVNEQENDEEIFIDSESESVSSDMEEHSIYDNDAWNIVGGNDGPDLVEQKLSAREIATANKRAKMAAQMRANMMEMEEVNEDDEEDASTPRKITKDD